MKKILKLYVPILLRIAALGASFLILYYLVFMFVPVSGNNMYPSIKDGDLLVGFRLENNFRKNDVAIYMHDGKEIPGRIIAEPGDVVIINEGGSVLVNGSLSSLDILFPTYPGEDLSYPYRVPEDSYFIMGDYRTESEDSRFFGAVPKSEIKTKVITILRHRGL